MFNNCDPMVMAAVFMSIVAIVEGAVLMSLVFKMKDDFNLKFRQHNNLLNDIRIDALPDMRIKMDDLAYKHRLLENALYNYRTERSKADESFLEDLEFVKCNVKLLEEAAGLNATHHEERLEDLERLCGGLFKGEGWCSKSLSECPIGALVSIMAKERNDDNA